MRTQCSAYRLLSYRSRGISPFKAGAHLRHLFLSFPPKRHAGTIHQHFVSSLIHAKRVAGSPVILVDSRIKVFSKRLRSVQWSAGFYPQRLREAISSSRFRPIFPRNTSIDARQSTPQYAVIIMPSVETVSHHEGGIRNEGLQESTDSGRKLPHSVTHGMAPASSSWLPLGMKETIHQWVSAN